MTDTNKNQQIDPNEAEETVEEEGIVNEEYLEGKIIAEDIERIKTLDNLSEKAKQIEMEKGMGGPAGVAEIKPEEIKAEEEKKPEQKDEEPAQPSAPTPAEVVREVTAEKRGEVAKELKPDSETLTELKKGI